MAKKPFIERRTSNQLVKLVMALLGFFTLIGVLVGAGITVGQHLKSDEEQDRRLTKIENDLSTLQTIAVSEHPKYSDAIYPPKE